MVMTCQYKGFLFHGEQLQAPILSTTGPQQIGSGCRPRIKKLAAPVSVARVWPRTSKGITDLFSPIFLRLSPPVSVIMNHAIKIAPHTNQTLVSFVNGINQTNRSTN